MNFMVRILSYSANATLEKSKMKKDLDSLKSHVMEVERYAYVSNVNDLA